MKFKSTGANTEREQAFRADTKSYHLKCEQQKYRTRANCSSTSNIVSKGLY